MFKLGGFSIKRSKGSADLDLAKTKVSLTALADSLRNKNEPGQDDPDKEKEEEDSEDKNDVIESDGLANDGEIDIYKNAKNRFEERFSELHEEIEKELRFQADLAEGKNVERAGPKVATAGRIQFEGIMVEEEIPPMELCDNCETRYSVAYCEGCKECFCIRCVELCHPIPSNENKHPHEVETVLYPALIREIKEGDKSSVVVPEEFPVPNTFIEEHELAAAKNIDLNVPNSLATNYHDPAAFPKPLSKDKPYSTMPRFKVDDKVLFDDPVTGKQAYGRIISEWDHRHGAVAPPIIRGEGSMYMYVVEKIDLIANVGSLRELLRHIKEKEKTPDFPTFLFGDTGNVPYREEFAAAREVNRMVREMQEVKEHGPRRHYKEDQEAREKREMEARQKEIADIAQKKAEFMASQGLLEEGDDDSIEGNGGGGDGSVDDRSVVTLDLGDLTSLPGLAGGSIVIEASAATRGGKNTSTSAAKKVRKTDVSDTSVVNPFTGYGYTTKMEPLTKEQEQKMIEELAERERAEKRAAMQEADASAQSELPAWYTELSKEEQLDRIREALPGNEAGGTGDVTSPRLASKRSFMHAVLKDNPAYFAQQEENERGAKAMAEKKQKSNLAMGASRVSYKNSEPKKVVDEDRALNVLVMPEYSLADPSEEFDLSQAHAEAKNLGRKEAVLNRVLRSLRRRLERGPFKLWKKQMDHLLLVKENHCSRRIQTVARVWLCRNMLDKLLDHYLWQVEQKRLNLHSQFQYCSRETPFCVTMDHKLFFRTKLGANKYSTVLRLLCTKIFNFTRRKASTQLTFWFHVWRRNATGIDESVIKYGHFDMRAFDIDDALEPADTGDLGERGEHFFPGQDPKVVVGLRRAKLKAELLKAAADKAAMSEKKRLERAIALAGTKGNVNGEMALDEATLVSASDGMTDSVLDSSVGGDSLSSWLASPDKGGGGALVSSGPQGFTGAQRAQDKAGDGENLDEGAKKAVESWLSHPNATPGSSVSTATQKAAFEIYAKFRKGGPRNAGIGTNHDTYVNVSTMTLGLVRTPAIRPTAEQEAVRRAKILEKKKMKGYYDEEVDENEGAFDPDGELPPYMPSLDVKLPPAIPVWMPTTAEERLHVSNSRRLTYCSYKAHMQGPADDVCWVIPGRLAMGAIPWGNANQRTQTSSITAILLGGCDVFVSLMEEEEEIDCEKRLDIKPIASLLKSAAAKAKIAVDNVVRDSKRVCDEMEKKLRLIPALQPKHPAYDANKKELTRIKARSKLANEAAVRAKQEFERLPKVFEWIRVPLKVDQCPSMHDMLPVCWQLERMISEGRSLYLYSREGHGRVGLLAGCLLGRLYGFTPQETLIRIQNSHDCARREEGRPVPVSCPQLRNHRDLITQVVTQSNRAIQGTVHRSHSDPETMQDVLYKPKKGTGSGKDYITVEKVAQQPLTQSHSNVHSTEMDTRYMQRKKESVRYDTKLERDVVPSYHSEHGRGDDSSDLAELYELDTKPNRIRQMRDVVRYTRLQRSDPEGRGPDDRATPMPSLRVRAEGL